MKNETMALLEIFKSHLGSTRDKCDDNGKKLWDRIEDANLAQLDACLYAMELGTAVMEVMNNERKPSKLPVEPMVRLVAYARTGTCKNATLKT